YVGVPRGGIGCLPEACLTVSSTSWSVSGSLPPKSCLVWSQSRLKAALTRSHFESESLFHHFGLRLSFMIVISPLLQLPLNTWSGMDRIASGVFCGGLGCGEP